MSYPPFDTVDYTSEYYEDLLAVIQEQMSDEWEDVEEFEDAAAIHYSGFSGDLAPWLTAEMAARDTVSQLSLPDAVDTADTLVNDVFMGLGGAVAGDVAKMLRTQDLATIVDNFGTAATASNPSLATQATSALDDFA